MSTQRRLAFRIAAAAALVFATAWTCAAQDATPPDVPVSGPASGPTADPAAPPPAPAPPPAAQADAAPAADGFRVGGFTFKPGGRIKLDVIRDFKPIGNEDSFDTRTIPVDGSEGTNSNIIAKETRLNLDIRGPWQDKELQMFFEADFYGTSSAFRLRHAYGTLGRPAGRSDLDHVRGRRQPAAHDRLRSADRLRADSSGAGAVDAEDRQLGDAGTPRSKTTSRRSSIPSGIPGKAEYPAPDLVTKFRFDFGRSARVRLRLPRQRPSSAPPKATRIRVSLWGTAVSAKFFTWGKDYAYGIVTCGDGIGRYRGGMTAVPDESDQLHAVGGTAFMGGYEHFWSERWSTNGVYSFGRPPRSRSTRPSVNKELTYGAVNLLWWFLGDRGWMGVEYLYGHREVFGDDDNGGSAHRVQYAVRFNLP